ncbi:hypothetical protein [Amnibacterium endophyticum]|uniref:CHAT domain-containing protein n=1 Tax=Amnibacterium endophyticum TaxID=2109337 RepID=A0ABW4LCV4_9MICO
MPDRVTLVSSCNAGVAARGAAGAAREIAAMLLEAAAVHERSGRAALAAGHRRRAEQCDDLADRAEQAEADGR